MTQLLAALQALLFVAGEEGVSLEELSYILDVEKTAARQQVEALSAYLNQEGAGLEIIETGHRYQLVTTAQVKPFLEKYATSPYSAQLSGASLETLAIIAYKQPITRIEIDELRGVQSTGPLQKLLMRDLIQEAGRQEGPGRPKLYKTTAYFLDYFGLVSLEDLPDAANLFDMSDQASQQLFKDNQDLLDSLALKEED